MLGVLTGSVRPAEEDGTETFSYLFLFRSQVFFTVVDNRTQREKSISGLCDNIRLSVFYTHPLHLETYSRVVYGLKRFLFGYSMTQANIGMFLRKGKYSHYSIFKYTALQCNIREKIFIRCFLCIKVIYMAMLWVRGLLMGLQELDYDHLLF